MFLIWLANQIAGDDRYKEILGETPTEERYNNLTNYKQFLYYYKENPGLTDIKLKDKNFKTILDKINNRDSNDWLTEKDVKIFAHILQINIIVFVSTDITPSFYPTEPNQNNNKYIAIFNWSRTHFESIRINQSFIIDKSIGDKMYEKSQSKTKSGCNFENNNDVKWNNKYYKVYERRVDTNQNCIGYQLFPVDKDYNKIVAKYNIEYGKIENEIKSMTKPQTQSDFNAEIVHKQNVLLADLLHKFNVVYVTQLGTVSALTVAEQTEVSKYVEDFSHL